MNELLSQINILLAQTAEQRKLTILYVSIFAFFCLMLVIDSREKKMYVSGKTLQKIVTFALIITLIILVILYFNK